MASLPKTFKAAVAETANSPLVLKDIELKLPSRGQVLVKVLACGVCHTDTMVTSGRFGDVFPRIPGHEIVGDVVAVGEGVTRFQNGDRVGGGWHGGHDQTCLACNRAFFQACEHRVNNGFTIDGGYAEYALLRHEAVVRVPRDLDPAQAAPLLDAGVTTFNAIRKMHVEQGNLVAVQGLGGLGHLAVQFARAMGYRVAAVSGGGAKRELALRLGAHEYVDAGAADAAARLRQLGGAALVLSTVPDPDRIGPLLAGLQVGGKLVVLAPVGPVPFDTSFLVDNAASVHGWPSGHALDGEETLRFAQTHGVKCMVETFPLADANKATEHMLSNKVRFRGVLIM